MCELFAILTGCGITSVNIYQEDIRQCILIWVVLTFLEYFHTTCL
jgi:hypothetical protein